jgi:hypothetical protein
MFLVFISCASLPGDIRITIADVHQAPIDDTWDDVVITYVVSNTGESAILTVQVWFVIVFMDDTEEIHADEEIYDTFYGGQEKDYEFVVNGTAGKEVDTESCAIVNHSLERDDFGRGCE